MKVKEHHFGGDCQEKYSKVQTAFKQNFADGWEHEGAALAVYHNDQLVVDIWGGFSDASSGRLWNKDTMSTVFSCTKSLCALSAAKLVDSNHMSYEDLVTKHWPDFGQNGKENITVRQLLSHQAGLVAIDSPITLEHYKDYEKMAKVFEEQTPNWTPDEGMGYHMTTYGCLANQLVRRCDPQHRSIGQYFREEIMHKTGPESMMIGMPPDLEHRMARLSNASQKNNLLHLKKYKELRSCAWRMATGKNTIMMKSFGNPNFFDHPAGLLVLNNPEYRFVEWGACTGVGTARGLAQPYNALCQRKLLSPETVKLIDTPDIGGVDKVVGMTGRWGPGFQYQQSPTHTDKWLFGHCGFGGQCVKVDMDNGLAWAYITNGIKPLAEGDLCLTYERLQNALYESL